MIRFPGEPGQDWDFDDMGIPYQIPYIPPVDQPVSNYEPKDKHLLRIKAESGRLPDFLTLDEIAYLLGYRASVFKEFIQNEPLELEYIEYSIEEDNGDKFLHRISGMTREKFKAYPREVVKRSLQLNAAAVMFAHNHPSGITDPSQADKQITTKLKEALGLIDIRTLDHFIIGNGEAYSFAEHGLI